MSPRQTANTVAIKRPRRTAPLVDFDKQALMFITNWSTARSAGKARDKARDFVKAWFAKGGDPDHEITVNENGSQIVEFAEPVLVDGKKVLGLENRRTVRSELDLDLVDEWLDSLPEAQREALSRKLYKKVVEHVFQPDALFALQQEGVITEEQLDALFSTTETWALCVTED